MWLKPIMIQRIFDTISVLIQDSYINIFFFYFENIKHKVKSIHEIENRKLLNEYWMLCESHLKICYDTFMFLLLDYWGMLAMFKKSNVEMNE